MKIVDAGIPNMLMVNKIPVVNLTPIQDGYSYQPDPSGENEEIMPNMISSYWLSDMYYPDAPVDHYKFNDHAICSDNVFCAKHFTNGVSAELRNAIRPILFVNDIPNRARYRIGKYMFDTIPNESILICTELIGVSEYTNFAYNENHLARPNIHNYENSNVKLMVDNWLNTIMDCEIEPLEIIRVDTDITLKVNYTTWATNEADAIGLLAKRYHDIQTVVSQLDGFAGTTVKL